MSVNPRRLIAISFQLVTLPYNLLLQKSAREALGFDLKDQVVVIDEAHSKFWQDLRGDMSPTNHEHRLN
jgi:Rad3-related DNA helicase